MAAAVRGGVAIYYGDAAPCGRNAPRALPPAPLEPAAAPGVPRGMQIRESGLIALAACAFAACGDDTAATPTPAEEWTAEPEYQFGDQLAGDALFGRIRDVRPTADGSRVYVLDSQSAHVTIWTPDGTLIGRAGGLGEGPGEFSNPGPLLLHGDRFQVGDIGLSRYTTFTLDGEVVRTDGFRSMVGPPGMDPAAMGPAAASRVFTLFRVMTMFGDGSVGALGQPEWTMDAGMPVGDAPAVAVLRASQEGGVWGLDTLGLLSFEDVYAPLDHPEYGRTSFLQPWIRPDHYQMDPWNGSVVISRPLRDQGGRLELIDISIVGDTLWTRQIQLPPVPVTDDDVETQVDDLVAFAGGDRSAGRAIRSALIVPSHWHATNEVRLMSNGEIWFEQAGRDRVWYAVRKGEDGPIRTVVLPERFRPMDVNATHVWGVRYDELDVESVAGLRLARAGG